VVFLAATAHTTTFQHRGYTITLLLRGQECLWDVQHPTPQALCTTMGFWLEFKIVTDATVLDMFHFPSASDRHATMEADIFYATRYALPPDAPADWFKSSTRASYHQAMHRDVGPSGASDTTVTVLIEEKTRPSLVCNDVRFSSLTDMYQPLTVSWSSSSQRHSTTACPPSREP
jgi:hypothetical protein